VSCDGIMRIIALLLLRWISMLMAAWPRPCRPVRTGRLWLLWKNFFRIFSIPHMRDRTQRGVLCRDWCNSV